jgi:thiol-disulfide isomerase/thioredoxin
MPASIPGNSCEGRNYCVVVYLAPWCPYCREEIPYLRTLLDKTRNGDTGLKVVVGLGHSPGDNEAMADKIAKQGVMIDTNRKIATSLGVRSLPTFTVLDKTGLKISEGQTSRRWLAEKFGN